MAGSAAAAKDKKAIGNQKANKFEKLTDSITVANGKAKVKGQVNALGKEKAKRRTSGKEKVEISANGKSLAFTAQKIVKQMNKGVEKGYWKIKKSAGELDVDLTEKGRSNFSRVTTIAKAGSRSKATVMGNQRLTATWAILMTTLSMRFNGEAHYLPAPSLSLLRSPPILEQLHWRRL